MKDAVSAIAFLALGAEVTCTELGTDINPPFMDNRALGVRPARGAAPPGGVCGQRRGDDRLVGDADGDRT
ncbi:MAG: hypothetical protein ACR2HJ_09395 [Fimbriimonadales bacterium]